MNKKTKNIIFLSIIPIIIISVMIHNYFFDSNNLFARKSELNIYLCSKDYANLCLEEGKDFKNEVLFTGSSELFVYLNNKDLFMNLPLHRYSYKEFYELVKYYLDLHPETKRVVLFQGFNILFFHYPDEPYSPENKDNKFIMKLKLLLNIKPVTEHLFPVKRNFMTVPTKLRGKAYFPFDLRNYVREGRITNNYEEENKFYIKKLIEELQERNIEYTILIPPINMISSSIMYLAPDYYKQAEDFKRYIVNNFGPIYDFTRYNKYTSMNLLDGNNYLYKDPVHINKRYGIKLINFLIFDHNPYDDLYYLITKDNVEEILQKEREEIVQYIQNNKSYVEYYIEHGGVDKFYYLLDNKDAVSQDTINDLIFLVTKMKELNLDPTLLTMMYKE